MAIEKGKKIREQINHISYTQKSVGIDPSFGSSAFGIVITELVDGLINVLYADEFHRPDFDTMISTTVRLLEEHNIRFDNPCRIFVDAANPSFITTLKQAVNEDFDYVSRILQEELSFSGYLQFLQQNMFVIPVPKNCSNIRVGTFLYILVSTN